MIRKHTIFCLLIIFISSCVTHHQKEQGKCSANYLNSLKVTAWDAERKDNKLLARDSFEKICHCLDVEGCLNALSYYSFNEPKWLFLNKQACDLGNGNACFWLGESTKGEISKAYYEKGCSLPLENADGSSCRMAGAHNADNYNKASSYLEKGCLLGDIKSCIEAYKFIKEPIRKLRIKKLSCEIGVPEVCSSTNT